MLMYLDIDLVHDLSIEVKEKCHHLVHTKRMRRFHKEERDSANRITPEAKRLTEPLQVRNDLAQHGSFFPLTPTSSTIPRKEEVRHWEYDIYSQKRVPRES